jgi:hypothetical protein
MFCYLSWKRALKRCERSVGETGVSIPLCGKLLCDVTILDIIVRLSDLNLPFRNKDLQLSTLLHPFRAEMYNLGYARASHGA